MAQTFLVPGLATKPLAQIRPYWRNPRQISDKAIAAVADSIREYGYQQPIVVDTDDVIITGHTRYAALRRLGADEVSVIVADLPTAKAKQYRVLDNRVGEYSDWDMDKLVVELREFENSVLADHFPDIDLELGQIANAADQYAVTEADMDAAQAKVTQRTQTAVDTVTATCPSCYHVFELKV